jgi:ribulose-phosphate 3-epimerase
MPKKTTKIIPAILAKDKKELKKQLNKIEKYFDYVQIDIMDGILVNTKNNLNPLAIKELLKKYDLEIHLMVKDVSSYIIKWQKLKNVKKIIWHFEAEEGSEAIICLAKYLNKNKIKAGLAINPNTSITKITKLIKYFDTIQIMGVIPGAQGKAFETKTIGKIKNLRNKYPDLNISVDGAVSDKNIQAIKKAGANIIAVGSYFQNSKDIKSDLKKL